MTKSKQKTQYGDFQTPSVLATQACDVLRAHLANPASILEPTCGRGAFLSAAARQFLGAKKIVGLDINLSHTKHAEQELAAFATNAQTNIICHDFFSFDWESLVSDLPQPILILGNPPWVTNSELGSIGSTNLPMKTNFQRHKGIDAITGKSNFDISEWMIRQACRWMHGRQGTIAVLCKTSVARKVLRKAWENNYEIQWTKIYQIDAKFHFNASVDACFLVIDFTPRAASTTCDIFAELSVSKQPAATFGFVDDAFVSDVDAFRACSRFRTSNGFKWRSGVKHDCANVMQLTSSGDGLVNGLGERVAIESNFLFPLVKSSDLANGNYANPQRQRWVIVTQRHVGEDTERIRRIAPKTWRYLRDHAELLDRRASSIYRGKPPFSIFGVGDYTFSPWKVAISGLYKHLSFRAIGPRNDKPVVFDDTCYFIACDAKQNAMLISKILNSAPAQQFLSSLVFWDDKRPITSHLLSQIDVTAIAEELGFPTDMPELANVGSRADRQPALFL